jgi:hypothetical protein
MSRRDPELGKARLAERHAKRLCPEDPLNPISLIDKAPTGRASHLSVERIRRHWTANAMVRTDWRIR